MLFSRFFMFNLYEYNFINQFLLKAFVIITDGWNYFLTQEIQMSISFWRKNNKYCIVGSRLNAIAHPVCFQLVAGMQL